MSRTYRQRAHFSEFQNEETYAKYTAGFEYGWSVRWFGVERVPKWIKPKSYEEHFEKARQEYRKASRDGYWNETGRNTGFKQAATKTVRNANKRYCQKVMKDPEAWHEESAPNGHEGDGHLWDFW